MSSHGEHQNGRVHYSRRHTFTLADSTAMSFVVFSGDTIVPGDLDLVLRRELGAGHTPEVIASTLGRSSYSDPEIGAVLLSPGNYSVEVVGASPGLSGRYHLYLDRSSARDVDRESARRLITVSDATVREGDGTAVFAVSVDPLGRDAPADARVTVQWETVAGSAVSRSDYGHASGSVTVPAGSRRATLSVPLVDDLHAEGAESFSLRLHSAEGAVLAVGVPEATIVDDDPAPSTPAPSASTCTDAQVTGSVGDVFDVTQSRYSQWTDVFVDVMVVCGGGSPGADGYRTGVEVLHGPAAPRSSRWCSRRSETPVTESLTAGVGCATVRTAAGSVPGSRSTHVVRVPDSAVGQVHQLLVWLDLDGDGVFDRGEPYQHVAADFVGRSVGGGTLVDVGLAGDLEARVLAGSDRISRAGQWTSVRVGLGAIVEPGIDDEHLTVPARTTPLANAPVAAFVSTGPSSTAQVHCVALPVAHAPTADHAAGCVTDDDGQVTFRWRAPADAAHALRRGRDTIRVFVDRDRDGVYDPDPLDILAASAGAEPSATFDIDIAKAVNYGALGDSYSSGEAGRSDAAGFVGTYRGEDIDPALANPNAARCRRWSEAYPEIFARRVLGNPDYGVAVTFDTFACSGALTENVHEPTDPEGLSVLERHNVTNRPSPHTDVRDIELDSEGEVTSIKIPTHWEPRQAVSLANARQRLQAQGRDIDMVTITIGGNDVNFSSIVQDCVTPGVGCGGGLSAVLAGVQGRVTATLRQVRAVVPEASVFVLGYSPLTPQPTACPPGDESCPALGRNGFIDECRVLSAAEVVRQSADHGLVSDIPIIGYGYFRASINDIADVATLAFSGSLRIDHVEAQFLWAGASGLNAALREAAEAAGVHYVDTVGGVVLAESPRGFVGHDPCSTDPWLHGFVVDSAESPVAVSGKAFHPTPAGHDGYSSLLEQYIRNQYAAGVELSEAGLPVNPEPRS